MRQIAASILRWLKNKNQLKVAWLNSFSPNSVMFFMTLLSFFCSSNRAKKISGFCVLCLLAALEALEDTATGQMLTNNGSCESPEAWHGLLQSIRASRPAIRSRMDGCI